MAKIKWKNKTDTERELKEQERELKEQEQLQKQKEKFKQKDFHTMSTKDKWELVYIALRQLGLID